MSFIDCCLTSYAFGLLFLELIFKPKYRRPDAEIKGDANGVETQSRIDKIAHQDLKKKLID